MCRYVDVSNSDLRQFAGSASLDALIQIGLVDNGTGN